MSSSSDSEGFVYDPSHEDDSERGPSKTSKTPTNNDEETTSLLNYEHEYDTFTNDVIGTSENNERNTTTFKREKKEETKKERRKKFRGN